MTNILYSLFSEVPKNDCEKGSRKPKFDFLGPKIVKGIGQPPRKILTLIFFTGSLFLIMHIFEFLSSLFFSIFSIQFHHLSLKHDYLAQPFQLSSGSSFLKTITFKTFQPSTFLQRDFCDRWQRNEKGQVVVHGSILN